MNKDNNDEESEQSQPSIRRKYQGGRRGRANINYGVVLKTSRREIHAKTEGNPAFEEEKIIINGDSKHNRGIAAEPIETDSKITTTKKYEKGGYLEKNKKLITVTKTETTESKNEQNNSRNAERKKEDKGPSISKISEITTTTNKNTSNINDNRNASQGRKIKEEVTTKTITTTTTNQVIRAENGGKKEITKKVTNETNQNNNQRPIKGKKEEITTTKTTTTVNQRSGSQNKDSNDKKEQITTIKTQTTNITTTNERQNRGKSEGQNQKIQINKEITTNQRNSSSSRGKNQDKGNIKETKPLEQPNSRGRSQGQSQKKETDTNQKQSSRRESQNKKPQVVKEVTSITSVGKRNEGNKNTVTRNRVMGTHPQANQGRKVQSIEERAKSLSISSNNQFGVHEYRSLQNKGNKGKAEAPSTSPPKKVEKVEKKDPIPNKIIQVQVQKVSVTDTAPQENKKPTITEAEIKQKNFRVQQPPQVLKTETNYNINTNKVTSKLAIKEKEKEQKPYSTNTEIIKSRHNLSRITINESGKTPKKNYVLHVRKLDRIQSNSKMRILYTNNMEETTPVKTNFNHNITIIRNVTSQNLFKNSNVSNIARKEINESGKEIKLPIKVNQRLNEIIRTEKKPYKLNYKDFNEKNAYKKLEVKSNLQNKMNNAVEQKSGRNSRNSSSKKDNAIKTTTTTETKLTMAKGGQNANKITTTTTTVKTETNTENKRGRFNQLQMSRGNKNNNENSLANENKSSGKVRGNSTNSRGSRGSKTENVSVGRRNGNQKGNETSTSKTVTVKTTQVVSSKSGSGSRNNSRSNSVSRGKKESTITTTKTITKTASKNESNQNGNQGGETRKIKTVRMIRTVKK